MNNGRQEGQGETNEWYKSRVANKVVSQYFTVKKRLLDKIPLTFAIDVEFIVVSITEFVKHLSIFTEVRVECSDLCDLKSIEIAI